MEVEGEDDAAIKATSKDVERSKEEHEEEEVASLQKKKAKKMKMKRSKEEKKGEKKQKSKRRRVREDEEKDQGGLRQKVRNLLGLAKKPLYDEPSVVLLQKLWRGRVARNQLHIHKKRQRIVRELVDTEKSYVHSLYTMMTCYLLPLRARASMLSLSDRMVPTSEQSSYFQNALRNINASLNIPTVVKLKKKRAKELLGGSGGKDKLAKDKKPLLSMQDHKTIFSQTEVIYNFNNHFLQTIQERLARWHYEQTIGDIFLSVMDFYKVYTECVNGYSAAMMTLTACESNKKFSHFMEDCNRAAAEMGGLRSLPSYLIQPVQRLPRYVLLLKDLLKHTDESHPDFANLTKATQRMCDVAQMVDERHKQAELLNHMFQIQNETKGLSRGYDYSTVDSAEITTIATGSLLAPHRRLTKWGKLCFSIEGKSPRMEEVQCYLFTDLLLLLSEQQSRSSPRMERTCRHRLPLLTLSLPSSLSTSKGKEDGKFLLSTSRDTFVFECQSAEEGVEWMTALRDNIRHLLEKQATFEAAKLQGATKKLS